MTRFSFLSGTLLAALCLFGGRDGFAQASGPSTTNAGPVADAPQPQKKQAAATTKPAAPDAGSGTQQSSDSASPSNSGGDSSGNAGGNSSETSPAANTPSPAANDNAFPEDISRRAAGASQAASPSPDSLAAKPGSQPAPSSGGANPFPEDVSRQAEKAARNAEKTNEPPLPPGVSSSQSSGIVDSSDSGLPAGDTKGGTLEITNPSRASKDTQVGDFYLQRQDAKGAYLRYQDAIRFDPTNVDAIFGVAEAARMLGKPAEAARNYQLYLDIVPHGPKSKRALKGLQALSQAPQSHGR